MHYDVYGCRFHFKNLFSSLFFTLDNFIIYFLNHLQSATETNEYLILVITLFSCKNHYLILLYISYFFAEIIFVFPFVSWMLTLICWSIFIIAPLLFVRYFQHLLHVGVTVWYLFPGNFGLYPGCCTYFIVIPWVLFKSYKECYFCFSGQLAQLKFRSPVPTGLYWVVPWGSI